MNCYNGCYYDQYFTGLPGDAEYYLSQIENCTGGVLELGCGTGRILAPIVRSGIEVWGIDHNESLLDIAREKLAALEGASQCFRLIHADISDFDIDRQFDAVIIPYRTFQHILSPTDQREVLSRIRKHLSPGGELTFNIFDPSMELGASHNAAGLRKDTDFIDRSSGNRIVVWYAREYDLELQIMEQELVFEEIDHENRGVSRQSSLLTLRYSFRHEVEYLLECCGFEVVELLGDFGGGGFKGYGEQIWRARKS